MDLTQRSRRRRAHVEVGEPIAPVRPQLRRHPAGHKGWAHRRGVGLQLRQFARVFGRQRLRDGGQHLGDLHHRPLEAAERSSQVGRGSRGRTFATDQAAAGRADGDTADLRPHPRIAAESSAAGVLFCGTGHRSRSYTP